MAKPRMLVVASRLPHPLNGAYGRRQFFLNQTLSPCYDVDIICPTLRPLEHQARADLSQVFRNVYAVRVPRWRYGYNAARGLLDSRPLQVCLYAFREISEWVQQHWREYDLAVFQHVRTVPYAENVGGKKLLDLHDAISLNYSRALQYQIGMWRPVYQVELPRLRRFEVSCLRDFARVFIVSQVDKAYLGCLGADVSRIEVVPVGIPDELLNDRTEAHGEGNWIVFLGRLATAPNSDAAEYFTRMVFPLIRSSCDAKLLILGSDPPRRILKLQKQPRVEVRANIPDAYEYLRMAKVVIAPIRFGAGMQNKVLEAMALGKAVVATSLAVAGIEGAPGQHFLVADEPEEMAAAILQLWKDQELRCRIGVAARELIRQRYSYTVVGEMYRRSIESAL